MLAWIPLEILCTWRTLELSPASHSPSFVQGSRITLEPELDFALNRHGRDFLGVTANLWQSTPTFTAGKKTSKIFSSVQSRTRFAATTALKKRMSDISPRIEKTLHELYIRWPERIWIRPVTYFLSYKNGWILYDYKKTGSGQTLKTGMETSQRSG